MPSESYPHKCLGRKADIVLDSTKLTGWIFLVHEIPSFSQQSLECHRAYLYPILSEHPSCMLLPNTLWVLGKDRKSTRLNSSHLGISYAVFCLKKKNSVVADDCRILLTPYQSTADR